MGPSNFWMIPLTRQCMAVSVLIVSGRAPGYLDVLRRQWPSTATSGSARPPSRACGHAPGGRFRLPFPSSHYVGAPRDPPPGATRNTPPPRRFEMDPLVTLIVTPKDRYSALDQRIDNVHRHTNEQLRPWYLDIEHQ